MMLVSGKLLSAEHRSFSLIDEIYDAIGRVVRNNHIRALLASWCLLLTLANLFTEALPHLVCLQSPERVLQVCDAPACVPEVQSACSARQSRSGISVLFECTSKMKEA